jgi:hypothetical protein
MWGVLTGLLWLESPPGLVPHGLAVLLELVVAALLPGRGADLNQGPTCQKELQVPVSLQAWGGEHSDQKMLTRSPWLWGRHAFMVD